MSKRLALRTKPSVALTDLDSPLLPSTALCSRQPSITLADLDSPLLPSQISTAFCYLYEYPRQPSVAFTNTLDSPLLPPRILTAL
ncbi:hypothetical protein M430DRAFT_22213 [Amorphotheca resinae ATCC 22711]|uniref:Uncharacterized protein n=1 Tax=Amorphotheca resinae ATCC 22711 TaxID=857342 RepID=A0A2T3ATS0_AMORE|nr:hypothetical protein M430DRAFT_22213 [Amorphotheca resinae ATCC 22711]PSS10876.1 hypothetical protein M430DRAFT_22213 [Amorphotheca resinae ATCC 22711]